MKEAQTLPRSHRRAREREIEYINKRLESITTSFELNITEVVDDAIPYREVFQYHNSLWMLTADSWNSKPNRHITINPRAFFEKYAPVEKERAA